MKDEHLNLTSAIHLREVFRFIAQASKLCVKKANDYISITTDIKTPGGNYILGVGEESTDYQRFLDHFKREKLPFIWFSYPLTLTLDDSLKSYGLVPISSLTHVICNLKQSLPFRIKDPNLSLVPVEGRDLFKVWKEINASVWNRSLEVTRRFYEGLDPDTPQESPIRMFLVRRGQDYVGCSLMYVQDDIAGCYWDSVLPPYRHQGVGIKMIYHRQEIAKSLGCSFMVAQCLGTSLGLYLKAGFSKGSSLALYRSMQVSS